MIKHDFQELRREVDRWSLSEVAALSRWEKAQWNACGDEPDGNNFDTVGDAAGARLQLNLNRKDELIGLVLMAEGADSAGDADRVEALVCEFYRKLGRSDFPPVSGFTDALDFELDPYPPNIANISLREQAEHDYDALRRAVDRWREEELRMIEHTALERMSAHAVEPGCGDCETVGDSAGVWLVDLQSRAEELRALIRRAEECERHGDVDQADALVGALQERLGVADEASVQIEAYLHNAKRKASSKRQWMALSWAGLYVAALRKSCRALARMLVSSARSTAPVRRRGHGL